MSDEKEKGIVVIGAGHIEKSAALLASLKTLTGAENIIVVSDSENPDVQNEIKKVNSKLKGNADAIILGVAADLMFSKRREPEPIIIHAMPELPQLPFIPNERAGRGKKARNRGRW